jgi:hypothetical protein
MALYEVRRAVLHRAALPEYRRHVFGSLWPALAATGGRPLCLLSGLIGLPADETYLVTGFPDLEAWQRAQTLLGGTDPDTGTAVGDRERRATLIREESARLFLDSGVRPKLSTPDVDRRSVYGMRRFWLSGTDWPEFVRHSAEGIWPRIESQGACILGLFRDAATTEPLEALLLTGYHGPAHWEETRGYGEGARRVTDDLRAPDEQSRRGRNAITLRSYVCLMTAHWPE